jgi:hypothetical protein
LKSALAPEALQYLIHSLSIGYDIEGGVRIFDEGAIQPSPPSRDLAYSLSAVDKNLDTACTFTLLLAPQA